jgi:serine/threonine protein kinase
MAVTPELRTLGRYEIVAKLGAGGVGEVYRARDSRLKREVALKVLPSHWMSDPERRRRLEQEAREASALNHPNIVTCPMLPDPIVSASSIGSTPYRRRSGRSPCSLPRCTE